MTAVAWRDTTDVARPDWDGAWHRAQWLVGRHPRLAALVERMDCVDLGSEDGGPWVDVDMLAAAVAAHDTWQAAWKGYAGAWNGPADEEAYERWRGAGPKPEPELRDRVDAFAVMSSGEKRQLRLLATLAGGDRRVGFSASDVYGLDGDGQRLVREWCSLLAPELAAVAR